MTILSLIGLGRVEREAAAYRRHVGELLHNQQEAIRQPFKLYGLPEGLDQAARRSIEGTTPTTRNQTQRPSR